MADRSQAAEAVGSHRGNGKAEPSGPARGLNTGIAAAVTVVLALLAGGPVRAGEPALTMPTAAQVAAHFVQPPNRYGIGLWWGWGGPMDAASISHDLDTIKHMGFTVACVEADNGITSKYLSPAWFNLVKTAIADARKRDMYLWFEDEAKYPSGFAGGKFTTERPDLRMQVLAPVPGPAIAVAAGQTLDRTVGPDVVAALATEAGSARHESLEVRNGRLLWTAPAGSWQVRLIRHEFRTSPTRSVNNPHVGAKDRSESLEDYLKPAATRQFIAWTHAQYARAVGGALGHTVLGFTGDEPDFTIGDAVPWTNALFARFRRVKGYDIRPWIGSFFARDRTEQERRARADYWDVWSRMFQQNFFGLIGKWCAAHGCEYQLHINHEDMLNLLQRSEGDFFRCMQPVQMPGIDVIWRQIWPGHPADFPKLASSAAHVFGRPRDYTESFAAMNPPPDPAQAEWILNEQFARGVNTVEIMWWSSPTSRKGRAFREMMARFRKLHPSFHRAPSFFTTPQFPAAAAYLHRASYVLSMGRPTARIALYVPFTSMWLGDMGSYASCLSLSRELLRHQRDFDFIGEQALSSVLDLRGGRFVNRSDQSYEAVVIPSVTVLSKADLQRLHRFADAGGTVIFGGREPTMVEGRTFLHAGPPPDLSWARHDPSGKLTPAILATLPPPDVALDRACPDIVYTHRRLANADLYFFFNQSTTRTESARATLAGSGRVQVWNAHTGAITTLAGASQGHGTVTVPLSLGPSQTEFIVVGPAAVTGKTGT